MIGPARRPRIALAHDWLVCLRGSELVLDRLARLFGPTDLYTLVSNGHPLTEAISACRVVTSPLQRFPAAAGRLRRAYLPLMPWAVGRIDVGPCDLVISSSSCVMKSIRRPPGALHLCYCHTPNRYVWFPEHSPSRGLARWGVRAWGERFRRWDRRTAAGVDQFVAPSSHIAARIERSFGRSAVVVPPPVRTSFFTPDPSVAREDFWLIAAALEPIKRVDLAVEAARRAGRRLVVAGEGSQRARLESMAGPGVRFTGWTRAEELRDLARRAAAFLCPSVEDFGIAAVEALACGCPVVALGAGGALDALDATCGAFMAEQSVESLLEAASRLPCVPEACRSRAELFGEEAFDRAMRGRVEALLSGTVSS